jgi:hypothetical protein
MIWVEILARHHEVAARFRFADQDVRIGRGYDNDVILDDPYVAARHMRIFRDESGRLVAEDVGSANGMYLDRERSRRQRIVVDGERPIRIGHTYLRIREASHAVERERVAGTSVLALPIALATALGGMILGVEALAVWFAETAEPKASSYLQPLRDIVIATVIWVAMWALFSRIFSGRARFLRNLLIALSGLVAYSLYNEFAQFSAFALTWRTPVDYGYVVLWSILAAVCILHLREVSPSRQLLKGGLVVTLLAFVIAVQTLQQTEVFYNVGRQTTLRRLMPPALRLVPLRDENAFFAEIERLKTKLDNDRKEARADDARR